MSTDSWQREAMPAGPEPGAATSERRSIVLPLLGVGTAVLLLVADFLVLRFAPAPAAVALVVSVILLVGLAVLGFLATGRGQAATFVAIALLLPYALFAVVTYAGADRIATEISSVFDEGGDLGGFEEGDSYGSNPELDALQDACGSGDDDACDELFIRSPPGSDYEQFADDNGGGI